MHRRHSTQWWAKISSEASKEHPRKAEEALEKIGKEQVDEVQEIRKLLGEEIQKN